MKIGRGNISLILLLSYIAQNVHDCLGLYLTVLACFAVSAVCYKQQCCREVREGRCNVIALWGRSLEVPQILNDACLSYVCGLCVKEENVNIFWLTKNPLPPFMSILAYLILPVVFLTFPRNWYIRKMWKVHIVKLYRHLSAIYYEISMSESTCRAQSDSVQENPILVALGKGDLGWGLEGGM